MSGRQVKLITLVLTRREATALNAIAGEGAEGLFTDTAAAKAYIGGQRDVDAAQRALEKLRVAINKHREAHANV